MQLHRELLTHNAPWHLRESLEATHGAQLLFLDLEKDLVGGRARQGRVIEGHGDLKPEHICLLPEGPIAFDCIEFNAEFRTIDILDELAFLAIECEHLGDEELGNQILFDYKQQSDPQVPAALVEFYKSYRASVRAKVLSLQLEQQEDPSCSRLKQEIEDYGQLAAKHAARLEPKWVFIVGGGMGSGKSTLAKALADRYGLTLFQTDVIRQQLWGSAKEKEGFGQGRYSQENRRAVYDELFDRVADRLQRGLAVVVDGSFNNEEVRQEIHRVAHNHQARTSFVWCQCSTEEAQRRILQRSSQGNDPSDARPELVEALLKEGQPPKADAIIVNTEQSFDQELEGFLNKLQEIHGLYESGQDRVATSAATAPATTARLPANGQLTS